MKLNIIKNLGEDMDEFDIDEFISQLKERLEMIGKTLVIDRFEEGLAVCEDRDTRQIYNIEKNKLPEDAKEGSIIKYDNGKYVIDKEEIEVSNRIKDKMDKLWED